VDDPECAKAHPYNFERIHLNINLVKAGGIVNRMYFTLITSAVPLPLQNLASHPVLCDSVMCSTGLVIVSHLAISQLKAKVLLKTSALAPYVCSEHDHVRLIYVTD